MLKPRFDKLKSTSNDKIVESLGDRPFTIEAATGKALSLIAGDSQLDLTDGHAVLTGQLDFGAESAYIRKEEGDLVVAGNSNNTILRSDVNDWTFDTDGILTLPENGDIVDSNGDSVLGGGTGGVSGDPRLTIHGYLDGVTVPGTDARYVTFTTGDVPPNGLYLTKYVSSDNRAWFAMQEGPAWTASQTEYTPLMLAAGHFGPDATYINALGVNALGTTGYQFLPNTTYTIWIQQINARCEYAFSTSPLDSGNDTYSAYSNVKASPTQLQFYDIVGSGPAVKAESTRLSNTVLQGNTTHGQLIEAIRTKSGAGLTVVHDFSTTSTWYHSMISQDFVPNFTNLSTTNERVITSKLILAQGSSPYIPTGVKIAGTDYTVNWLDSTAPSGTANKKDVVTFTFIRTGSVWIVLGKLETYGTV